MREDGREACWPLRGVMYDWPLNGAMQGWIPAAGPFLVGLSAQSLLSAIGVIFGERVYVVVLPQVSNPSDFVSQRYRPHSNSWRSH